MNVRQAARSGVAMPVTRSVSSMSQTTTRAASGEDRWTGAVASRYPRGARRAAANARRCFGCAPAGASSTRTRRPLPYPGRARTAGVQPRRQAARDSRCAARCHRVARGRPVPSGQPAIRALRPRPAVTTPAGVRRPRTARRDRYPGRWPMPPPPGARTPAPRPGAACPGSASAAAGTGR